MIFPPAILRCLWPCCAALLVSAGGALAQPGAVDPGFSSTISGAVSSWNYGDFQYDGRSLIAGWFEAVNGQPVRKIVRLAGNGAVDSTFQFQRSVIANCLQPAGNEGWFAVTSRSVAAGDLSTLHLLDAEGRLVKDLAVTTGSIRRILPQPDGKILIGGSFNMVAYNLRNGIARLNEDGSTDQTFTFGLPASATLRDFAVQPDGRILVYGIFTKGLVRLNADGSVDPSFSPELSYTGSSAFPFDVQVQRDGRIIVAGNFNKVNGITRNNIARLHPDGSVDESFSGDVTGTVQSISLLEGGQALITGDITSVGGIPRGRRARLNADGSLDLSYNGGTAPAGMFGALDPEGRVHLSNGTRLQNSAIRSELKRLGGKLVWEREGALPEVVSARFEVRSGPEGEWADLGQPVKVGGNWELDGLDLPAAGAVRVRGTGHHTKRMGEAHLSLAAALPAVEFVPAAGGPSGGQLDFGGEVVGRERLRTIRMRNLSSQSIPAVMVGVAGPDAGRFSVVSQSSDTLPPYGSMTLLIRFLADSTGTKSASLAVTSAAPGFVPPALALTGEGIAEYRPVMEEVGIVPFSATDFNASAHTLGPITFLYPPNGGSTYRIIESNGTAMGRFTNAPSAGRATGIYQGHAYDLVVSYVSSGTYHAVDVRLNNSRPLATYSAGLLWPGGALAIQEDGKMIMSGGFRRIGSVDREKIARLHPDGSLDLNFNGSCDVAAECILPLPDGRILLGGNFTTVGGLPRRGIARLHHDGSVDASFDLGLDNGSVRLVALPGGKILVGGVFTTVEGTPRSGLVRLHPDGTVDGSFNAAVFESVTNLFALAVQDDGKILAGGRFGMGGETRYLVRLSADGVPDGTFLAQPDFVVSSLVVQKDGRILVGGHFNRMGSTPRSKIARLHPDGSCDEDFAKFIQLNGAVSTIAPQTDGRIMIGGTFSTANGLLPRAGVARLHATGELDVSYYTGSGTPFIWSILHDESGGLFVSGEFSGGMYKLGSTGSSVLEVVDGNRIEWKRTGSAPALRSVTFESSSDGRSWTPLGAGVETSAGWVLADVSPPVSGFIRARGQSIVSNRGYASVRKVKMINRESTALENWRSSRFGSMFSENDGADHADPDKDGVSNLMEYALGLNPTDAASRALPSWIPGNGRYEMNFTGLPASGGIIYAAEWSTTMAEGDWHPAEDLSVGDQKSFRVPVGAEERKFFRLKVANP